MKAKTFEIRDSNTFIPMLAVQLSTLCEPDRYLIARAGFGSNPEQQKEYVLLCQLTGGGGNCFTDLYDWPGIGRTYKVAHDYIEKNFEVLQTGAVIDVEFILGETKIQKTSERLAL